ncbi:uncharacterized protein [Temnothorax nylanderi]|uniref:uncharacterized protein n=1 Tax=Temnothorax nylanderi TaxID=102681 RepID=UPI003A8AB37F
MLTQISDCKLRSCKDLQERDQPQEQAQQQQEAEQPPLLEQPLAQQQQAANVQPLALQQQEANDQPMAQIQQQGPITCTNKYYFPESWSHSLVYLIPKPHGGGVRPIALTSCILKLLEKLILNRLHWVMESRALSESLVPDFQFGFRKFRSCSDNLTILTSEIQEGFLQNKMTAALFIDVKGAFDNVVPDILIRDLLELGFPKRICQFVQNLIHSRNVQFVVDGKLTPLRTSQKGTPQGSVLSPTLFNIYLRKIAKLLHSRTKLLQFADDIVIYATATNLRKAIDSLQKSLEQIQKYFRDRGLEISPTKTQLMIFSPFKRNYNHCVIRIDDRVIGPSETVRFLGVVLDPKLSGTAHMDYLISKARITANIISSLRGVWWGAHPQLLLNVYRAILRGSLEYAFHIFCLQNSTKFHRLEIIPNKAIRVSLGYRISTPINTMFAEAKEPPLKLRLQYLAAKYLIKVQSVTNHPVTQSLSQIAYYAMQDPERAEYVARNFPLAEAFRGVEQTVRYIYKSTILPTFQYSFYSSFFSPPHYYPGPDLMSIFSRIPRQQVQTAFEQAFGDVMRDTLVFYTDGSKTQSGNYVGSACHSPQIQLQIMHKLPSQTSVFTAEAWAIYNAVLLCLDLRPTCATIVTDSKSVLEAFAAPYLRKCNYLIPLIKAKLLMARERGTRIQFIWIPSHIGIAGNEIADSLAKRAIREGTPPPQFKIPYTDLFAVSKERLDNRFKDYLATRARDKGTHYYNNIYRESSKPWYYKSGLSRGTIVTVNRIRANHYNLNHSLYRKNLIDDSSCPCGNRIQDINHLVFYCPITIRHSIGLREFICKSKGPSCRDIYDNLRKPTSKVCRLIMAFCKAIEVQI